MKSHRPDPLDGSHKIAHEVKASVVPERKNDFTDSAAFMNFCILIRVSSISLVAFSLRNGRHDEIFRVGFE